MRNGAWLEMQRRVGPQSPAKWWPLHILSVYTARVEIPALAVTLVNRYKPGTSVSLSANQWSQQAGGKGWSPHVRRFSRQQSWWPPGCSRRARRRTRVQREPGGPGRLEALARPRPTLPNPAAPKQRKAPPSDRALVATS